MFHLFKKPTRNIVAPTTGILRSISTVSDPMYSQKMIGDGFVIEPVSGNIVSPVDGEVVVVFPTKHAIGIRCHDGLEVLLHVGIDTFELKGKGFKSQIKKGSKVYAGDLLITADLSYLKKKGYCFSVLTVFASGQNFSLEHLPYNQLIGSKDVLIERE